MHIDRYRFGEIVVEGKTYTSDIIIYPDRVAPSWWRKQGHEVQKADIADIVSARPDLLIIGTGDMGIMHVPDSTIRYLASLQIEVLIEKTDRAVHLFNNQPTGKKVVGAFHLTC